MSSESALAWAIVIVQLAPGQRIRRSDFLCPPDLTGTAQSHLTPVSTAVLLEWAEHAKAAAAEARHVDIRESYDHARYQNFQYFQRLLLRGTLDQSTLQAAQALGTCILSTWSR